MFHNMKALRLKLFVKPGTGNSSIGTDTIKFTKLMDAPIQKQNKSQNQENENWAALPSEILTKCFG